MSYDPYADCPCGSGKKIKFCCHAVISDMQKVSRLRENQPSRALQILEGLSEAHPTNLWVASVRARLLMDSGDFATTRDVCQDFLKEDEHNTEMTALLGLASFIADGYELAKRDIHRAFQLSARREPAVISRLAGAISMLMLEGESFLSARAHAALALKYAPQEQRQHFLVQLARIEGSSRIPYPLRSVHRLAKFTAAVEDQPTVDRASRLSALGCWQPAAILFGRLAEKNPDVAEIHHNLGLCLAWDGNEAAATESLHQAASLYTEINESEAVECETLAQLIDLELTAEVHDVRLTAYDVHGVGKLLSTLDAADRIDRLDESYHQEPGIVAQYRVLETPFPSDVEPASLKAEQVPVFTADIAVMENDDDAGPSLHITGVDGEGFDEADELLRQTAGDLITPREDGEETIGVVPQEFSALEWNCHFPADFPATAARDLETERMRTLAIDVWPDLELNGLGGKTPLQAVEDIDLRIALAASVFVLDAFYDRNNAILDIEAVRKKLGLPEPGGITLGDDSESVSGLSTITMQRLDFAKLDDEGLVSAARRLLLVRHTRTALRVLEETAKRSACLKRLGAERVYSTLLAIAREQNHRDEAFRWIDAGRQAAAESEDSFRQVLEWEIRELNLRVDDPSDPHIPELWKQFEEKYFAKLPEIREEICGFMEQKGLGHLISESAMSSASGTVWTPESEQSSGSGKLWTPGQD